MRPLRLFVILLLLTVTALAVVYLRVANVRTAYRVQVHHARQVKLRYRLWRQQARIAELSEPGRIRQQVDLESLPVAPPRLPTGDLRHPDVGGEWETD